MEPKPREKEITLYFTNKRNTYTLGTVDEGSASRYFKVFPSKITKTKLPLEVSKILGSIDKSQIIASVALDENVQLGKASLESILKTQAESNGHPFLRIPLNTERIRPMKEGNFLVQYSDKGRVTVLNEEVIRIDKRTILIQ
ncbi:MAG TPA: hypothetical protein VJB94_05230 [Candidatus Nanoarchaeia archaeon]|nr:hypothetical protein [Candidatus Nanoarchaeia archaeon]